MIFDFSWFNTTVTAYWKHLLSFLLIGLIVAFLFFIQSGESTYNPPQFRFILWHLWYNKRTSSKTNSLPFINSKLFSYLFLGESKSFFSSTSSLIIISMLSLFECIARSWSLSMEKVKLFAIVNWIFHVSDFLRLFDIF